MFNSSKSVLSLIAFALFTATASTANAQWSVFGPQGQMTNYTTGRVYVGTQGYNNPAVRFDVVETCELVGRDIAFHSYVGTPVSGARSTAIWGESNNAKGRGVVGFHFSPHGSGYGVWGGTASEEGTGVFGSATHTSGQSYAGAFKNSSSNGVGVYASAGNSQEEGDFSAGVWGNTTTRFGYAGYFTGGSSYFDSRVGIGTDATYTDSMLSVAGFVFGPTVHVLNWSNETLASGISADVGGNGAMFGVAAVSAANWNEEENGNGYAVSAYSVGGITARFTNENPNTPNFFAGVFDGNVRVTGSLSKSGGSFIVDHPLDPKNKYLYHSFVESPDMMNIYNGIARTGPDGYAVITMPSYFEALNRDFRYQLTVIDEHDDSWALAKVVSEISGNEFTIRTNLPNQKVSWQVTGIRHDAWAENNRIPTEVEKGLSEKGTYLYPEGFGAAAKSENARRLELLRSQKPKADEDPRLAKPARKAPVLNEPALAPAMAIPASSSGN